MFWQVEAIVVVVRTPSESRVHNPSAGEHNRVGEVNRSDRREQNLVDTPRREGSFQRTSLDGSSSERIPQRRRHSAGRSERRQNRDRTESESDESLESSCCRKRRKTIRRVREANREYAESREGGRREVTQKIPRILCDKFGDKATREFRMFEKEFSSMCKFYSVPLEQKVERFLYHLEGSVHVRAPSLPGGRKIFLPAALSLQNKAYTWHCPLSRTF